MASGSLLPPDGDLDGDDDDKEGDDGDNKEGDIYIMMHVCLFVTKNDHFLLGVSCNHLNPPSPPCTTPGQF